MEKESTPTLETAQFLQNAYDFFNRKLFESKLPHCMLVLQRQSANSYGYFSPDRWTQAKGLHVHEISLNPIHFAQSSLLDVYSTILHEQCHMYQYLFLKRPRRGYHDQEFSRIMQKVGLMPSSTGEPGGNKTGQFMSDYPIPSGPFLQECKNLVKEGVTLKWFDAEAIYFDQRPGLRESDTVIDIDAIPFGEMANVSLLNIFDTDQSFETINDNFIDSVLNSNFSHLVDTMNWSTNYSPTAAKKKNKIKYSCSCGNNVWGKADLRLICANCDEDYFENN
jgi:predicted SprT family Zn-dependent metalloprotease